MFDEEKGRVTLYGWVQSVRDLGKIIFVSIRDIKGVYQVTVTKDTPASIVEKARGLRDESLVKVIGRKNNNEKVAGGYEIIPEELDVMTSAEQPVPLNLNKNVVSSLDKELDYRFLSLRRQNISAIFKIESTVTNSIGRFFEKEGFYSIHSSKIVSQATEGGANVFPVIYFDKTAYLAQSPQFYKQMMMAAGFEKVFEIGPVFRAEPHHTTRHLTEYTSVDIEMSFIKSYEEIMRVMEGMMVNIYSDVMKDNKPELKLLGITLKVPKTPFPQVSVREAQKILATYGKTSKEGEDLDPEGERIIGKHVEDTTGSQFFFLTRFPWEVAQFYHMRDDKDKSVTYRADLIFKGLEITTLAQREHRYDVLVSQAKDKGLDPEKFRFYLDFFRYGVPPHGGSGTGLERIVKQMLNLENVAEATLLPRTPDRLVP